MREKGRAAIYEMGGIYLLITDYTLWSRLSESTGFEHMLMTVFAIIFAIAGAGLIGFGTFMMHSLWKQQRNK